TRRKAAPGPRRPAARQGPARAAETLRRAEPPRRSRLAVGVARGSPLAGASITVQAGPTVIVMSERAAYAVRPWRARSSRRSAPCDGFVEGTGGYGGGPQANRAST